MSRQIPRQIVDEPPPFRILGIRHFRGPARDEAILPWRESLVKNVLKDEIAYTSQRGDTSKVTNLLVWKGSMVAQIQTPQINKRIGYIQRVQNIAIDLV